MSSQTNQASGASQTRRADDLWDQAYTKLRKDIPELARKYEALVSKEILLGDPYMPFDSEQIVQIMKTCQERVETERIYVTKITVSEILSKTASLATWAKSWIDSAVQASPEASMAWAVASMALPLLIRPAAAEHDCTRGFIYVTDRMVYYNTLENTLINLDSYFKDGIVAFYRVVLEYQVKAVLRFYRNAFKNFGRDIALQDDWPGMLATIKTAETTLRQGSVQCATTKSQMQLRELSRAADDRNLRLEELIMLTKEGIAISQNIRDSLAQQMPFQEETLSILKDISDKLSFNRINNPQPPLVADESRSSFVAMKMISISRDEGFVKRDMLMDSLHQKCSRPASTTALIGLGGTGKSQLAIEHSHNVFDHGKSVFWIYAGSYTRFEQGFRMLARKLGFSDWDNSDVNVFSIIQGWLENENNGPWLLVLDNLDDASFIDNIPEKFAMSGQPLRSYLPTVDQGSILVTTRSKQSARYLVEDQDFIFVNPMSGAEAMALFGSKAPRQKNEIECVELVRELDFMPLAIVHAASYIAQRGWHVKRYLELFSKSDAQKSKLLGSQKNDLRRDRESQATILTTWQITFDHINEFQPSAAYLLSVMSLFDRNSIPQQVVLFERGKHYGADSENKEFDTWRDSYTNDETALEDDILVLKEYFLVTEHADKQSLQMHRLVQLGMHIWLEKNNRSSKINQSFLQILKNGFPNVTDTDAGDTWQRILPHYMAAESRAPYDEVCRLDWASILYAAAFCRVRMQGDFAVAKQLLRECVDIRVECLGKTHRITLESYCYLAACEWGSGRVEVAETSLRELLKLQVEVLGQTHMDTLETMHGLGTLMTGAKDNLDEAESLLMLVKEGYQKSFQQDDPNIIQVMDDIASLRVQQRRLRDAEVLLKQAVESSQKTLGRTHVRTMNRRINLLEFYREQLGRPNLEETIEIVDSLHELLSEEDTYFMFAKFELGEAYNDTDQIIEAIRIFHELKSIITRVLGYNSLFYSRAIDFLLRAYIDLEQRTSIENILPEIVQFRKMTIGTQDEYEGIAMVFLARAYYGLDRLAEAEDLLNIALRSDLSSEVQQYSKPKEILVFNILETRKKNRSKHTAGRDDRRADKYPRTKRF